MARDYKNAAAKKKAKLKPIGSSVSFASGLAIGLLVALAVYVLKLGVSDKQDQTFADPIDNSAVYAGDEFTEKLKRPERKFEFYKILPEIEVKVPDWEIPSPAKKNDAAARGGTFVLQVGSFKQFADADRAKAQLALTGIEAKIHRVVINGQEVWYRVHVGPYSDNAKLHNMRAKLTASGTDFIILKIGDG